MPDQPSEAPGWPVGLKTQPEGPIVKGNRGINAQTVDQIVPNSSCTGDKAGGKDCGGGVVFERFMRSNVVVLVDVILDTGT